VFSAFTAIGKSWDVVVYSSGDTGAAAGLALQVTEHNQALDPDPNATTG
jgi:hypothetical protein